MKNKKTNRHLLLIWIIFWNVYPSFATPQSPDYLIIGQDTIPIYTYLFKEKEALLQKDSNYMNKNQVFSDCWRAYTATWKVEEGALYLLELASCSNGIYGDETMRALLGEYYQAAEMELVFADLSLLFPDKYKNGKVVADWYSGAVIIPKGAAMYNKNKGYSAIFEFEYEMTFKEGGLTKERTYDNQKTSLNYFEGDLRNLILEHCEEEIAKEIKTEGKVLRIIPIVYYNAKQRVVAVKYRHRPISSLQKKIKKRLLEIKNWNIYYKKGKPVLRPQTVYLYFDEKVLSNYQNSKE